MGKDLKAVRRPGNDPTTGTYGFPCIDCKGYSALYMVNDDLWEEFVGDYLAGLVCMACFEKRMGRRIELSDLKEETERQCLNGLVFHMVKTGALRNHNICL